MNDAVLALMVAEMDQALAGVEPVLPAHPEHTRQVEVLRALTLGLGNFERMRARRASAGRPTVAPPRLIYQRT